jgi:hypothetical protein
MKRRVNIGALSWIVLGALICFLARRIRLGTFGEPGPGFIAFGAGLFLSGVGIIMLLTTAFSAADTEERAPWGRLFPAGSRVRLVYTIALLFVYTIFLDRIGYVVGTFFLMWGLFLNWERPRWVASMLASLVTVGVTYIVFEVWLHCQFPRGILPL